MLPRKGPLAVYAESSSSTDTTLHGVNPNLPLPLPLVPNYKLWLSPRTLTTYHALPLRTRWHIKHALAYQPAGPTGNKIRSGPVRLETFKRHRAETRKWQQTRCSRSPNKKC